MTARTLLVLGKSGQLAKALARLGGTDQNLSLHFLGRPEADFEDALGLRDAILTAAAAAKPDLIVNAAAYTAVDKAEDEPERALAVNGEALAVIGETAAALGCPVIHVSTDYVFDGRGERPYRPGDPTNPQSVYGASKLAGEQALAGAQPQHVILRTAWVYDAEGQNFMNTMLRLAESRDSLSVVADQTGAPTVADDLAEAVLTVARQILGDGPQVWGVFHYSGAGATTWCGFARAIFEEAARLGWPTAAVSPTTTEAFGAKAPRPAYSLLDCASLADAYGITQKDWRGRLTDVMAARAARTRPQGQ